MAPHIPDEKKIKAVQEVEAGTKTSRQICVEYGIQSTQFKGWKAKFGGAVSAAPDDKDAPVVLQSRVNELLEEVKGLKAENQQLREMYMDLLLEQRKARVSPEKKK